MAAKTLQVLGAVLADASAADGILNYLHPSAACSFQGSPCDARTFARSLLASVLQENASVVQSSLTVGAEPAGLVVGPPPDGGDPVLTFHILLLITGSLASRGVAVPFKWGSALQQSPDTQTWLIAESQFVSGAALG